MGSSRRRGRRPKTTRQSTLILLAVLLAGACLCSLAGSVIVQRVWRSMNSSFAADPDTLAAQTVTWPADSATLTVAVSPAMADTLAERATAFNRLRTTTPDGQVMAVELVEMTPQEMVGLALEHPGFQAISPDSSLWLNQLDQRWTELYPAEASGIARRRVSESTRYAVSPIVVAMWADVAAELGWPGQAIGWDEIQARATSDADFKWNHPSTQHAAGLLATLAEFYAGAGLTRGLTEEIATRPDVIDYVRAVESTVRFYGEGEDVIVERLAQEGRAFLDAFVAQEQTVIAWNATHADELVAVYPKEGTLWVDHPLALLELEGTGGSQVTDNQRRTYRAFAGFLLSGESQQAFLAAGYRPADLDIDLSAPGSPFAEIGAVDWRQPQTVLQIPSASVVDVVQNVWWYTKRPTNVYLVVDTSGSMEGAKIERTREALEAFVDQIQGERDRVGLVEFGSGIKHFEPLRSMDDNGRARLVEQIEEMRAVGYTALLDAVWQAHSDLQTVNDREAINAIVVMTDGQENDSYYTLFDLNQAVRDQQVPVVIFTIAFGGDAEEELLRELARIGGGQFRRADETDIEDLYQIISTYF